MHLSIPRPRRRTRRALLATALPAVLAAVALPSAAEAGSVSLSSTGALSYLDNANNENNDVSLRVEGNEIVITERGARITTSTSACEVFNLERAECPVNVSRVDVATFGGNDDVDYRLPHAGVASLGEGNDTLFAGGREAIGRAIQPVLYSGNSGHDIIGYGSADRGVTLTPEDGLANDGRPGDLENVDPTFETYFGTPFNDTLFGSASPDVMFGFGGRDIMAGGFGDDTFVSFAADGADEHHGGPGRDTMDYSGRSQSLTVQLDNVADDGEFNEHDNVRSNVENIIGGSAGDRLRSLGAFSRLEGRGGVDTLTGDGGPDTLIGGPEVDRLQGGTENDVIDSLDGVAENVDCGPGVDTLLRDSDGFVSCENIKVGVLRLAPKTITAKAGKAAHVRLSWRHPESWRKLRTIELRLYRDGAPVGEVTVRPRAQRITDDGAVRLVRKASRLTHKGKTVTARLAVRLDDSVAGQTLTAEMEATDTRGRRQLERDAGSIRVTE